MSASNAKTFVMASTPSELRLLLFKIDAIIGNTNGNIYEVMQAKNGKWFAWFSVNHQYIKQIDELVKGGKK